LRESLQPLKQNVLSILLNNEKSQIRNQILSFTRCLAEENFKITILEPIFRGQPQYIWISEPGQLFRSQFVLYSMDRTSRCNKVDAVRLYASHRLNLLLLRGQICVLYAQVLYVLLYVTLTIKDKGFKRYIICFQSQLEKKKNVWNL